jgi:hypothetical protein
VIPRHTLRRARGRGRADPSVSGRHGHVAFQALQVSFSTRASTGVFRVLWHVYLTRWEGPEREYDMVSMVSGMRVDMAMFWSNSSCYCGTGAWLCPRGSRRSQLWHMDWWFSLKPSGYLSVWPNQIGAHQVLDTMAAWKIFLYFPKLFCGCCSNKNWQLLVTLVCKVVVVWWKSKWGWSSSCFKFATLHSHNK